MRNRCAGLIACVFVVTITLPLAANLIGADGADPAAENRTLAAFPTFDGTWRSAAGYSDGLVRWFEDHFGFRAPLVRLHGQSRLFLLGSSPSAAVVLGSGGWLFYADDGAIEDYTNERALAPDEMATWQVSVKRTREWLRAKGIAHVLTIAPDKHVIYPEFVPSSVRRIGTVSRMDQLFDGFAASHVAALDLRPPLVAMKAHERVYHLTDTHWNGRGAWVAYTEIIEAVRAQVPAVPQPWPRSDFEPVSREIPGLDLARMIGLPRDLMEEDLDLAPTRQRRARVVDPPGAGPTDEVGRLVTQIDGSTLPSALVFRDSFTSALVPFLSEHFSRTVYLWQNEFDADAVLKEHPDVVVQEIAGRRLYSFVPAPNPVPH